MAELAANVTLTLVEFLDELPAAVRAHAIAMWIVVVPLVSLLPLLLRHSERKGWLGGYIPSMISALGVTGYAINHAQRRPSMPGQRESADSAARQAGR